MRPIDADALHADFINDLLCIKFGSALQGTPRSDIDISNVLERIEEAPTIEAEPVRHGYIVKKKRVIGRIEHRKCPECSHTWQKDKRCKIDEWLCSECGKVLAHNYANYCPNCGAKMDGCEEDS